MFKNNSTPIQPFEPMEQELHNKPGTFYLIPF